MKALLIAWKDTLVRFRDWKALVGMLAAPLIISALIGLAFGNLNANETPIENIPIAIVNADEGELGQVYADVLSSEDLADLLATETAADLDAAQGRVETGDLRAVIYIPASFSADVLSTTDEYPPQLGRSTVHVFTDPTAGVSPLIVKSIVDRITTDLNTVLLAGQLSGQQTAEYAPLLGPAMADLEAAIAAEVSPENFDFTSQLDLSITETGEAGGGFDVYAFFVPGMAVFFLMFSMFDGSRSILLEQTRGTLPRLMSTPTPLSELILGKMGGTFLSGILQFSILVVASTFIFNIDWGSSPLGVVTIMVLTVFAAAGLGALLTTFARNENQASIIASAVSLVFGALGGSFFPTANLSGIVDTASKFTINRWAIDGFSTLTIEGGSFADILPHAGVLAAIGAVTFVLALVGFQRRFVK